MGFGKDNLKESDHLEELRIDGNNIWYGFKWTGFSYLRIRKSQLLWAR